MIQVAWAAGAPAPLTTPGAGGAGGGRAVHAHLGIYLADGAFIEVPTSFSLKGPTQIEYRARWDGQGWAAIDSVAAAFAAESDPGSLFEVESLGHEPQERLDPNASGAGFADMDIFVDAQAIPLPPAAWAGLTTMAGLMAFAAIRRRRFR